VSVFVCAALLAATACSNGGSAAAGYTVRDSAGVRIVENEAPRGDVPLWRVGDAPLIDIGEVEWDAAYQLFQVGGVVRLEDGRIVVANGGTNELRFYDADGRYLQSAGRGGGGPGEFEGLGQIAVVGDSVVAYDWSLNRISVFDLAGRFVRSALVTWSSQAHPAAAGAFGDGRWLFTTSFTFAPSRISTAVRDTAPFVVLDAEGALLDSIGMFPSVEYFVMGDERQARAASLPFGKMTRYAVIGRHAYIGPTDRYEILRYTADAELDLIVRKERRRLPVTPQDVDDIKQEELEDAADGSWRQTLERMFLDMPIPSTMPAFDRLQVDAAGNLWVLEYRRPADKQPTWTVFADDGHVLGTVDTPPGLEIFEIGNDYVLGVWRDEMEVEHVRMYALNRTPTE